MHTSHACRRPQLGFTIIELLVVVAVSAILAAIVYPSFRFAIEKARRSDGIGALLMAQLAQERWRSNQASYASSVTDIGIATTSSGGHYALAVTTASPSGYELLASAQGVQQHDAVCRHLRLTMAGADVAYASGPDAAVSNPADVNRRCWSL